MFKLQELQLTQPEKFQKICDILSGLILNDDKIEKIKEVFISEMEMALNEEPSSLQMENTYIPELPDGTEEGIYLALDLGGTNFRVILMELANSKIINETVKHYHIDDSLRIGCGEALFDYLAQCVDSFAREQKLRSDWVYPMGFTFSFPMRQHSLDSGCLVTWTKSFNCHSVVGKDTVEMLRLSLAKCQRTNIKVLAILNDTTGTLIQGGRLDPKTRIGIVLGTGSNGCYMESANRVRHWETQRHGERHVIIDVEWGAFGDNGVLDFIKTKFDRSVDEGSLLKNSFTFEKYIGGKYLGELYRIILHDLYKNDLFLETLPETDFPQPWTLGSDNVSLVEQDIANNTTNKHLPKILETSFKCVDIRNIKKGSGANTNISTYTEDDLEIMRYVSGLISKRAAQLVAINTSCLLNRMDGETEITVAIDGSVYKHHTRLRHWITQYTNEWAPTKIVKFILAEDGSGKGAALVAAIAKKLNERALQLS